MNHRSSTFRISFNIIISLVMLTLLSACGANTNDTSQDNAIKDKTVTTQKSDSTQLFVAHDYVGSGVFTNLIEGPTSTPSGALYVVGFGSNSAIAKVTPQPDGKGNAVQFLKLPKGSTANALQYLSDGSVLAADYTGHKLYRINLQTKKTTIYATLKNAYQPNDFAIAPNGTIYASDPDWDNNAGQIWIIRPNGHATVVKENMGTTNGIAASPDGHFLYVNESAQRDILKFTIEPDGSLSHKQVFMTFKDFGLDGMRCDIKGNLYVARYGAGVILIISPKGKILHKVKLKGQKPTNMTFGGPEHRQVYVTLQARGAIETFRSRYPGMPYPSLPKH